MTSNICNAIDCTYNDSSNGCQRFQVASACPLRQKFPGKIDGPPECSQYWLYGRLDEQEIIEAIQHMEGLGYRTVSKEKYDAAKM
jgi:hypothetical protein